MKSRWFSRTTGILILALLLSFGFSALAATNETVDIEAFWAALEDDGFIVQQGKLGYINLIELYNSGLTDDCTGNNPSSPYLTYFLPAAPGQVLKNLLTDAPLDPEHQGLWVTNRLRPDEAVVYVGKTPPDCSYFSYRSYLMHRFFPEEESYKRIFAELGDTLNNLTIKTDGAEQDPFDRNTIIVTTADKGIDERVRAAAQSAGYSPASMNTDVIPSTLVRMGLDEEADIFSWIVRAAFFHDKEAGEGFIEDPPGVLLRVTPKDPVQLDPYQVPPLRVRGTGRTELNLMGALNDLREAILKRHGALQTREMVTSVWLYEGYDAIQRGIDILGPNRDAIYLRTEPFILKDDPNEFVILYGINHAVTGKATYSSCSVYGKKVLNGVGAVASPQLVGTAEDYLPGHPEAKYLYVWKVSRSDGDDAHTLQVPWGVKAYGIELGQEAFIGYRMYLEPATKVGPIWSEIIYDRAIHFSPETG